MSGSSGQTVIGMVYAGVVNAGEQSLVYALVAMGEGYIEMAWG